MASRSFQEQIEALLLRSVAERRSGGVMTPDLEAAALFESIAITLLLNPRAALYAAHLARNGLLAAAKREIEIIDELSTTIRDLGNTTFALTDTRDLQRAKLALLQVEAQEKLSATSPPIKKFESAVNSFLNKQLSKNVRRPGKTELTRPGSEAASDLPPTYTSLKDAHSDLLDRLYALAVSVENFLSAPLGTIVSLTTTARIRSDLEDLIGALEADTSGSQSRDAAVRLLSALSVLQTLGSLPNVSSPVVDTAQALPPGYELTIESEATFPTKTSLAAPFILPAGAWLEVQVGPTVISAIPFPQITTDLQNSPHVVGDFRSYPVTFDPEESLFIKVISFAAYDGSFTLQPDGTYTSSIPTLGAGWLKEAKEGFTKSLRVNFNPGVVPVASSLSTVKIALAAAGVGLYVVKEYIQDTTSRILLVANRIYLNSISISASHREPDPASTVDAFRYYTLSAHDKIGFTLGQRGEQTDTPVSFIVDSFNLLFGSLATAQAKSDGTITITGLDSSPGASLLISGPAGNILGINGTVTAVSDVCRLKGDVLGVAQDPVNPVPLVDVHDVVTTPAGESEVAALNTERITLADPLATFSGAVTVTSALYLAWKEFDSPFQVFVTEWLTGDYASALNSVDRVIAPLAGSPTPAQRNIALTVLEDLKTRLEALVTVLSNGELPPGSGVEEKKVINGIISSLQERKYDRALQFLLRGQLFELLTLDSHTASFGGALLRSLSDVARSDMRFPNTSIGEGDLAKGVIDKGGLLP